MFGGSYPYGILGHPSITSTPVFKEQTIHSRLTLCRIRDNINAKQERSAEEQRRWVRDNWMSNDEHIMSALAEIREAIAKPKETKKWWEFWK